MQARDLDKICFRIDMKSDFFSKYIIRNGAQWRIVGASAIKYYLILRRSNRCPPSYANGAVSVRLPHQLFYCNFWLPLSDKASFIMLISHEHKFIFVHVYKVAGTSITKALECFAHKPNLILAFLRRLGINQSSHEYSKLHTHSTAIEIKNNIPEQIFNTFFKFAFVRNPWDWQVSLYHYMLQNTAHRQHKLIKSM